jgi:hypothetical protein
MTCLKLLTTSLAAVSILGVVPLAQAQADGAQDAPRSPHFRSDTRPMRELREKLDARGCTGPISYCLIYFGH